MGTAGEHSDAPPTVRIEPSADPGSDAAPATLPEAVPTPARGDKIARFVVLETLGVGGMGVVVAAYDPELDRKVALKLLRPDVAPAEGTAAARGRLLREAKAMAKLRHPSVVTVFEVGEFDGQVFLAMEYVAGGTLSRWSEGQRGEAGGWARTVAAFVEAGRGLVAAHERGLIHRDFKPANVLIEDDRVQVTDFGIASIDGRELLAEHASPGRVGSADTTRRSDAGVLGTAPYMAAELAAGEPADELSDQFAFCVALFECLYGQRPFAGDGSVEVSDAIAQGRLLAPEHDHGVPQWVHQAVVRGLATDRDARWPSMAELVDTLASPETAEVGRRRRVAIGVAIGIAFVALPFAAKSLGPPFDRSTYPGVVGQTLTLLALLLAMASFSRELIVATAINRKAFASVLVVLLMQLPLELGNAALGVSVVASDIMHLVLWAAMAAMFAVVTDRRFVALALIYLAGLPIALLWPHHHLVVLGLTNAAFIGFVMLIWRRDPTPLRGAVAPRPARPDGRH